MWLLLAIWLKVLQWKWYFHTIAQLSSVLFLVHSSLVCPWLGTYYGISRKVCVCMILSTWYTGSSKKNLAKFSDTCSVRADGLRIVSEWEKGGKLKNARIFLHYAVFICMLFWEICHFLIKTARASGFISNDISLFAVRWLVKLEGKTKPYRNQTTYQKPSTIGKRVTFFSFR